MKKLILILVLFFLPIKAHAINIESATPNQDLNPLLPAIISISPLGLVPDYTEVTILGQGFGENYVSGKNQICFGNYCITDQTVNNYLKLWSDTEIKITAPNFITLEPSGTIKLKVYYAQANDYFHIISEETYTVLSRPIIKWYYAPMKTFETYSIGGESFGLTPGKLLINDIPMPISSWTDTEIFFQIHKDARSGDLVVENANGTPSETIQITIDVLKSFSNDPETHQQWYYENLKIPQAWELTEGSPNITVAVIDGGIDFSHEDLTHARWENTDEIAGNGIDDDHNGYIDDKYGWDFVNNRPDNYINAHGTNVAGVIAAKKDNQKGIAGIAPNVKIMSLNTALDDSLSSVDAVLKALKYAVDNGAHVINLSFGGDYGDNIYDSLFQYAYDKNVLIVVAAGNSNKDLEFSPESPVCNDLSFNAVIGVASLNKTNEKSEFSNFGKNCIDVSAPGEQITTTSINNSYTKIAAGTSFSAPIVSGIAALIKSHHPDWNIEEIKQTILNSALEINTLNPLYQNKLGKGLIDAHASLTATKPSVSYKPDNNPLAEIVETNIIVNIDIPKIETNEPQIIKEEPTKQPDQNDQENNNPPKTEDKNDSNTDPAPEKEIEPEVETFQPFPDTQNHRYSEAINYIKKLDIVQGYPDGTYKPNVNLNRAEFIKILINGFKITPDGKNCFPDVKTEWFAPYVCIAKKQGIISGYPDGTFKPDQKINFAEALKITILTAKIKIDAPNGLWYEPYLDFATKNNLSLSTNKNVSSIIKRGEMAEIIKWILTL